MIRNVVIEALFFCTVFAAVTSAFGNTPITIAGGMTYESSLPVVYIDFDGKASKIKKDASVDAHMKIVGNAVYGGDGSFLYDGSISIKGRGNTTWSLPKKPYKIKLDKKTDLFGFGKNKHWVLLANYQDESLMRNKIAYDLSGMLGLVQMESTWVDVVMNGEYIGNYQLCEHIRVGSSRIDIFDWDDVIDDADERKLAWLTNDPDRNITGGYIFELSAEYDEVSRFKTASGLKVMVKTPEYLKSNTQMFSYVKSFWQSLENAWLSPDKYDEDGRSWKEYADIDSMVAYWLVQEIMGNTDAVYKSRHAYKDIDSPLVFGPVWDFDWSSASAMMNAGATGWKCSVDQRVDNFYKYWLADAEFRAKAVVAYANVKEYLLSLVAPEGVLDGYRSYLSASAHQNEARWFFKRGFEADLAAFRGFLTSRIKWLDGVLGSEAALERSASALYGTTLAPTGPFAGTGGIDFVGRVLQNGKLVGTINLKSSKARNGYCRVKGEVVERDGHKRAVAAKKVRTCDSPALAISSVKLFGTPNTLAMKISDNAFIGMLGAYGVEGARAVDRLPNGKYVFRMKAFPQYADGYQISLEALPLEATVTVDGRNWTVAERSATEQTAKLKLTGNKKAGVFNGMFKVYATKGTRSKVFTATITGIIVDGQAQGIAAVEKLGVASEVSLQLAE